MHVVITGASSGIGAALAKVFTRHGHSVLIVARREERLMALCKELEGVNNTANQPDTGEVHCLAVDITAPEAPKAVFEHAIQIFGKVHVLINDAGMSPYQEFIDLSSRHLCQILALNILSLTQLCHLFMPHMLVHGEPSHVVNVGSVGGYAPLPRFSVYTGSKHYVRVFTNLLNYECRGSNVRVSALHPGGTLTEFPALAGQRIKKIGLKGMLTAEQVAEQAYPAILNGKRVIIPGTMNKMAALMGKMLPFPWAIRVMELIYDQGIDQVAPTYPL